MNLVNTQGLVLIGPGSEWFWAAAQFVVVVVSLVGLYRQLRQQNASNALQRMESLQGLWTSPFMIQARLRTAIWRKHRTTIAPTYEAQAALATLSDFFENLSDLEEEGYLTWKEVENTWGQSLVFWWTALESTIQTERARVSPLVSSGFERLARRTIDITTARGENWAPGESEFADALDVQIHRNIARLRVLREVAAGIIPEEPSRDVAEGDRSPVG